MYLVVECEVKRSNIDETCRVLRLSALIYYRLRNYAGSANRHHFLVKVFKSCKVNRKRESVNKCKDEIPESVLGAKLFPLY